MTTIRRGDIVEHLASIVGREKAAELVDEAARASGAHAADPDEAERILDQLATVRGAVGVSARMMRQRVRGSGAHRAPETLRTDPRAPGPPADHPNVARLVNMLAPAVGAERAAELVSDALATLGRDRRGLDRAGALAVLENLASRGGLIGTVARFAKARAHFELTD
ncbi:MAG: hypothetical protein U0234_10185 [Sandaracinus sp.]